MLGAAFPAEVAQESAYRTAAESAHVEEKRDRHLPARDHGGEGGPEAGRGRRAKRGGRVAGGSIGQHKPQKL